MADQLADLARRITDALTTLRRARAEVEHSANSTTRFREEMAENALNGLLERRLRAQMNAEATLLAGAAVGPRTGSVAPPEDAHGERSAVDRLGP